MKVAYITDALKWHQLLLILLPSSVAGLDTDDIELHLENQDTTVVVEVTWPRWLVGLHFFGHYSRREREHPNFSLRMNAVKLLQSSLRPTKDSQMKSRAEFQLDRHVQPTIRDEDCLLLGDATSGSCLLVIELSEPSNCVYDGKATKKVQLLQWMTMTTRTTLRNRPTSALIPS